MNTDAKKSGTKNRKSKSTKSELNSKFIKFSSLSLTEMEVVISLLISGGDGVVDNTHTFSVCLLHTQEL